MPDKSPILVPFNLTQNDGNITAADGTASTFSDIWKYRVPNGTGIVLQAGDQLSVYLYASGESGVSNTYVRLEVRDPAEEAVRLVFGPALYNRVREFTNRNTIARLGVPEPVKVFERQWIVLVAYDTGGTITNADSYFNLLTSKVAVPL